MRKATPIEFKLRFDYTNDDAALVMMFARDLVGSFNDDLLTTYTELQQRTHTEHLEFVLEQAVSAHVLPPETGVEQIRRLFKVYRSNFLAQQNYRPEPYTGRVTLLRASDRGEEFDQDETMGWSDLTSDEVDVHLVPGSHYTMIRKPHVAVLAEHLGAAIRQARTPDLIVASAVNSSAAAVSE